MPSQTHNQQSKPSLDGLEARWTERWELDRIYAFDRTAPRERVYSIDTPPPTVSGSLHLGSMFGYIQTDVIARFHRMRGEAVFYPMGWDDNGLPTERRVQNYFGVRCEPSLPYDPNLVAEPAGSGTDGKTQRPISRRNFVELCHALTAEDERAFEALWRQCGLSVDWTLTYATIGVESRRIAQQAFLNNLARGEAYNSEAPTMWDIDFRTAVAQAELEDREVASTSHRFAFPRTDGAGAVEIETTRPELLPACVALVAHPDDERYQPLVGNTVRTPVFGVEVPVLAHPKAEHDKGTGIAMVCTFGDTTDIIWWRELQLPLRAVMRRDGRFAASVPVWLEGTDGAAAWAELAGRTTNQARKAVLELAAVGGALIGEPRPITHAVKFYEKGERPLEIVTSRQWYIRNGAADPALRETMLARGRELDWHPPHMRFRYDHWIEGLNADWLISRQRFFGVPFPLWYPVGADGEPDYDHPLTPDAVSLPVDPQSEAPPGYTEEQRGEPAGFVGDPDIMDTWATSSLTPQIVCGWGQDDDLFARTYPMNLRPQGPEIIRTWLFATALRSQLEHDTLPWRHVAINGWILDPDRKKMSKSKGNVVTPAALLDQFGADGVRYWAASASPGTDTAADPAVMKIGRRLANKVLNASRFVHGVAGEGAGVGPEAIKATIDRAVLALLADVVDSAIRALSSYQLHRGLEATEEFFWTYCDDYLELVKSRAYDENSLPAEQRSAQATLRIIGDVVLRLFAPYLPFVTEEVWSWSHHGSIHAARGPDSAELRALAGDASPAVLTETAALLSAIRKAKSTQNRSLKTEVARLRVVDTPARLALLRAAVEDLLAAGVVTGNAQFVEGEPEITVKLAEPVAAS